MSLWLRQTSQAWFEGGLIVARQPDQAGYSPVVVVLFHGVGHGPLDQPLHPRASGTRWGAES
jgi:hypothetical protein